MQRKYESPLRAAQAEQTRRQLLEAAAELLAESGTEQLTIRQTAVRAGVSVPTAYRYFPSREDLLDEVGSWVDDRLGFNEYPFTLGAAADFAWPLYLGFARNDTMLRAQIANPAMREVHDRSVARRVEMIRRIMTDSLPELTPDQVNRFAGLMHLMLSSNTWFHMHDRWGLDGDQTAQLMSWAITTLTTAIQADPASIDRHQRSTASQETR